MLEQESFRCSPNLQFSNEQKSVEELSRPPLLKKYPAPKPTFSSANKTKALHIFNFILGLSLLGFLTWIYFNLDPFAPHKKCFTHLKSPSPDFVGRKEYLDQLHKEFTASRKRGFKHEVLVRELWGKGGLGKSELAIEFANRHLSDFSIVWTFYCDTPEHLEQGYRHLAEKLAIFTEKEPLEKLMKKVHFHLENHPFQLPWLLIYDNVETKLKDHPERGGMILITSQKKVLNPDFIIEIHPFSKNETAQLLEKITLEEKGNAMLQLAEDLEGIPLLVNFAAHYIKATPGCTTADYQKLFSSYVLTEGSPIWKKGDVNQRYFKSLVTSWQFPLEALKKEYPQALEWLFICGYLYPENICEEWIDLWLYRDALQNKDILQIKRKEILQTLQDFGIIRYEEKTRTFSLHRFLQYIIRETRKAHKGEDLGLAVSILAKYAKDYMLKGSLSWQQEKKWYLHASQVIRWLKSCSKAIDPKEEAYLYEGIAFWGTINNELYAEALEANYKVLELRKSVMAPNAPEIGTAYRHLAEVLYKRGRYPEALNACSKSQEILELNLVERPLEFAAILNSKGLILWETGESEKALEAHYEALRIRLNELGSKHALVGYSLNNTALCLRELGRHTEAMELCERALEIYRNVCKDHPWRVWALQNKAWILFYQKQTSQALKTFHHALALDISIRGANRSELAYCYNGIGWCHLHLGHFPKAKKAFKKASKLMLAIQENKSRPAIRAYKGLGWTYLKNRQFNKGFDYGFLYLQLTSEFYQGTPKMLATLEDFRQMLQEGVRLGAPLKRVKSVAGDAYKVSSRALGEGHSLTQFFFHVSCSNP